jgi:hypothetical protein
MEDKSLKKNDKKSPKKNEDAMKSEIEDDFVEDRPIDTEKS